MLPRLFPFTLPPKIETDNLIIQALTIEHLEEYHGLCREESTMKLYGLKPHQKIEDTQNTLDVLDQWFRANTAIRWGIFSKNDLQEKNSLVGDIGYWQFDVLRNRGELGAKISLRFKSRGWGYEACSAVIDFGFKELGLQGVDANISLANKASMALVKKLGFQRIGIRPQLSYSTAEESWQDMLFLSLNQRDWQYHE